MPIPKKKSGEKQSDYMIRCVPQMMQYHDKAQAIAICYKSFEQKKQLKNETRLSNTFNKLRQLRNIND